MVEFSVIIPVYNVEEYISQTMSSIFIQNFKDFEVIIINDGSTDKTKEIIENLKEKYKSEGIIIKIINFKKNLGLAAAKNKGISLASGRFLVIVDGDDWLTPNYFESIKNYFITYPDKVALCVNNYIYDEQSKKVIGQYWKEYPISNNKKLFYKLLRENFLTQPGAVYVKKIFEKIGKYDANLRQITEDYDLWLRIAYFFPNGIGILMDPLVFYRKRKGQITSKKSPYLDALSFYKMYINLPKKLISLSFYDKKLIRIYGLRKIVNLIGDCFKKKKLQDFFPLIVLFLKYFFHKNEN